MLSLDLVIYNETNYRAYCSKVCPALILNSKMTNSEI